MIYVFLGNGFEEMEAIAPIDILRRCEIEVKTVGVGDNFITGSHGVTINTDYVDIELKLGSDLDMIVLPGGMPGTLNLKNSKVVQDAIKFCAERNIYIGAICAAPSILGQMGLLRGRNAVCFPGFEEQLIDANITDDSVVVDGNIITAKGAGVSIEFGLTLAKLVAGEEKAEAIRNALQCKN